MPTNSDPYKNNPYEYNEEEEKKRPLFPDKENSLSEQYANADQLASTGASPPSTTSGNGIQDFRNSLLAGTSSAAQPQANFDQNLVKSFGPIGTGGNPDSVADTAGAQLSLGNQAPPDNGAVSEGIDKMWTPKSIPLPKGTKGTYFGDKGDPYWDTNSGKAMGNRIPWKEEERINNKQFSEWQMVPGDMAGSKDVRETLDNAGFRRATRKQPGEHITVEFKDGGTSTGRMMDETANTWPVGDKNGTPIKGRVDMFAPFEKLLPDGTKTPQQREADEKEWNQVNMPHDNKKVTGIRRASPNEWAAALMNNPPESPFSQTYNPLQEWDSQLVPPKKQKR